MSSAKAIEGQSHRPGLLLLPRGAPALVCFWKARPNSFRKNLTANRVSFRLPSAQNPGLLTVGRELCFVPGDPSPGRDVASRGVAVPPLAGRKDVPRRHPPLGSLVAEGSVPPRGSSQRTELTVPDFRVSSLSFAEEFMVFTVL